MTKLYKRKIRRKKRRGGSFILIFEKMKDSEDLLYFTASNSKSHEGIDFLRMQKNGNLHISFKKHLSFIFEEFVQPRSKIVCFVVFQSVVEDLKKNECFPLFLHRRS